MISNGRSPSSVAYANGAVCVVTTQYVSAFNADTGKPLWPEQMLDMRLGPGPTYVGSPIAYALLYAATDIPQARGDLVVPAPTTLSMSGTIFIRKLDFQFFEPQLGGTVAGQLTASGAGIDGESHVAVTLCGSSHHPDAQRDSPEGDSCQ